MPEARQGRETGNTHIFFLALLPVLSLSIVIVSLFNIYV